MNPTRFTTFEPLESRQLFSAGALDPSFSLDGKATVRFPNGGIGIAQDVAVQPDGKTVIAGFVETRAASGAKIRKFAVARLNVNGSMDTSFGADHNGTVSLAIGDRNDDRAHSVTLQRDGRIVVVGEASVTRTFDFDGTNMAIVRLLSNGTLDKSFDDDGKRTIKIGRFSVANDVTLQPDGKIVMAGTDTSGLFSPHNNFAIVRLNTNGSLDPSFARSIFGTGGKAVFDLGGTEFGNAVAIDTNGSPSTNPDFGKIVMAGVIRRSSRSDYGLLRLNSNGTLDKKFDGNGMLAGRVPGYSDAFVNGVLIQPGGKIVVVGNASDKSSTNDSPITLTRHNVDGTVDTSFGTESTGNGTAYIDLGGGDTGSDVIISSNGGLVAAGTSSGRFALVGLTKDGQIDTNFGNNGKVITSFGADGTAGQVRMAAAPGKRITVVGGDVFKTARYLDTGALVIRDGLLDNVISIRSARVSHPNLFSSSMIDELR
jgi:uncharacterized delta-60 repeat protein